MKLLIGSEKGGTGKSTVATNLAVEYAIRGNAVLLVDADKQRSAAKWSAYREEDGHAPRVISVEKLGAINETIAELSTHYDVTIVDVAGKDSSELRSAMIVADQLVLTTQSSQFDLDTIEDMNELVGQARILNPKLRARALLTRVPTNWFETESTDGRGYLSSFENIELLESQIHERKVYRDAVSKGQSVVELKDLKARNEIKALAEELAR